jgi:hypothetical protein
MRVSHIVLTGTWLWAEEESNLRPLRYQREYLGVYCIKLCELCEKSADHSVECNELMQPGLNLLRTVCGRGRAQPRPDLRAVCRRRSTSAEPNSNLPRRPGKPTGGVLARDDLDSVSQRYRD